MSLKVLLYKSLDHILAVMFDVYVHERKTFSFVYGAMDLVVQQCNVLKNNK
jgi:hypothetical protein